MRAFWGAYYAIIVGLILSYNIVFEVALDKDGTVLSHFRISRYIAEQCSMNALIIYQALVYKHISEQKHKLRKDALEAFHQREGEFKHKVSQYEEHFMSIHKEEFSRMGTRRKAQINGRMKELLAKNLRERVTTLGRTSEPQKQGGDGGKTVAHNVKGMLDDHHDDLLDDLVANGLKTIQRVAQAKVDQKA